MQQIKFRRIGKGKPFTFLGMALKECTESIAVLPRLTIDFCVRTCEFL